MKKILIIFAPITQVHLVERLRNEMRQKGYDIDAINSNSWKFIGGDTDIPLLYKALRGLLGYRVPRAFIMKLMLKKFLHILSNRYDIIDIHFFAREYVDFLNEINKPYKITVWGSDFYRMTNVDSIKKKPCYEGATLIQCETPSVKRDLIDYLPSIKEKIRVCNFGIDIIDEIDKVEKEGLKINNNIVITCGYNGSEGQQHFEMINTLRALPTELKNRIVAYFPVTYGLTPEYKEKLMRALADSDFRYKIFEKRLTDTELARLRLESDIALNIQVTDSLSSSLLQHLYAGSVVIVGDWLPYEIYDENKIYYITTSMDDMPQTLVQSIYNLNEEKVATKGNREKVRLMSSWEEVAKKQERVYQELMSITG